MLCGALLNIREKQPCCASTSICINYKKIVFYQWEGEILLNYNFGTSPTLKWKILGKWNKRKGTGEIVSSSLSVSDALGSQEVLLYLLMFSWHVGAPRHVECIVVCLFVCLATVTKQTVCEHSYLSGTVLYSESIFRYAEMHPVGVGGASLWSVSEIPLAEGNPAIGCPAQMFCQLYVPPFIES